MKIIILMSIMFIMCGCVSKQGYIAILDLDFRTPEQITAQIPEIEAVYKDWTLPEEVIENGELAQKGSLSLTWWETILNFLSGIEGRITLFQLRWAK